MKPVLRIKALCIRAGADPETAFRLDIPALTLHRSQCLAISGPSGCGKSTLLEVLALLRRPDSSACFQLFADAVSAPLDLNQITDLAHLRQGPIGYVPQMGGVLPFLTAQAHVEAALHLAGTERSKTAIARLETFARELDLSAHLGKRRAQLSGGQRKRVALLAGLSVPRTLLIVDEPTAGLDAQNALRVLEKLVWVAKEEGTAVLIATHDIDAARHAGFEIAAIQGGRLVPGSAKVGVSRHG